MPRSAQTEAAYLRLRKQVRQLLRLDIVRKSARGETELQVRSVCYRLLRLCSPLERECLAEDRPAAWITAAVVTAHIEGREHPSDAELYLWIKTDFYSQLYIRARI